MRVGPTDPDRLPALAAEIAAKNPAVIVAVTGSRALTVAVKVAPKIPIVQASGGDFVAAGYAATLARPSGMVTGTSNIPTETSEKYLELLLAAAPKLKRIGFLALTHRWPVVGGSRGWSEDGALLSYGVDATANYRRAAYYVDRIVKGTKPGDLPIEQATRFELVVNVKTAKALGLRVPQELLVRADRVIE